MKGKRLDVLELEGIEALDINPQRKTRSSASRFMAPSPHAIIALRLD